MTIRTTLFVIALAVFGFLSGWAPWTGRNLRGLGGILGTYTAFLVWMLFVIACVSPDKRASLSEFWHEWVVAALNLVLGVVVATGSRRVAPAGWKGHFFAVLTFPLAILVMVRNGDALVQWIQTGAVPWQVVRIVHSKHDMSVLANLLIAVLLAEVLVRLRSGRRTLSLPAWLMGALAGAALFSNYLGMSRNGNLELIVIVMCGLLLFAVDHRRSMRWHQLAGGIGIALVLAGGYYVTSVVTDPRWTLLVESMKIGWDSERHLSWLDPEHPDNPILPDGRRADGSAFERVANLKEALKLVREHPWGWNIDRDVYHRLIYAKYRQGRQRGASLSGLLDVAIMVGVVGLGLWLAFVVQAGALGAKAYVRHGDILPALLLLLVVAFGFRSGIDSIIRDHFLEQFMFLVGLLGAGAMADERAEGRR
jgi:hypothetical protein